MTPPPTATAAPAPTRRRPAPPRRYLAIRADLLPEEIVDGRRLGVLQRRLGIALITLLALLIVWFLGEAYRTHDAKGDLQSAQDSYNALVRKQHDYEPLVTAQNGAARINSTLVKLMAGDVQWTSLLDTLRHSAPAGVQLTTINGTMTAGAAASKGRSSDAGLAVLNDSGKAEVGTLTLTGTASDKKAVAAYVDSLAKVPGLAAPFPASVTSASGQLTFSVSVIITADALGGRYEGTK